jgi:hypothetical protein
VIESGENVAFSLKIAGVPWVRADGLNDMESASQAAAGKIRIRIGT